MKRRMMPPGGPLPPTGLPLGGPLGGGPGGGVPGMKPGFSNPNSPHPSQARLTPDHTFDDGSKLSLGGFPAAGPYR